MFLLTVYSQIYMRNSSWLYLEIHPTLVNPSIKRFYIVNHKSTWADSWAEKCPTFQNLIIRPVAGIFKFVIWNAINSCNLCIRYVPVACQNWTVIYWTENIICSDFTSGIQSINWFLLWLFKPQNQPHSVIRNWTFQTARKWGGRSWHYRDTWGRVWKVTK